MFSFDLFVHPALQFVPTEATTGVTERTVAAAAVEEVAAVPGRVGRGALMTGINVDRRAKEADAAAEEVIVATTAAGTETATALTVAIAGTTVTGERLAAEATGTNVVSLLVQEGI